MSHWLGPLPLSNYFIGRAGQQIQYIAVHHSEASMASMDAHFHNPAAGVSAHYGVGLDGQVVQWVKDEDAAYAVGNFTGNLMSVSVEHEELCDDAFTDVQYAASAALVRRLCLENGIPIQRGGWPGLPGVVPHREFSATACPGSLDIDRIIREAQEDTLSQAEVDAINQHTDAKIAELYSVMEATIRRSMRGAEPFAAGNDTPIVPGEHIFPEHAK